MQSVCPMPFVKTVCLICKAGRCTSSEEQLPQPGVNLISSISFKADAYLGCRSGLKCESQAKRSLIPSLLKQKTQLPQQHTGSTKAEHEDLTSSAASMHSTMPWDAIASPVTVLGLESTPERQSATFKDDQLDRASADQVTP